MPEHSTLDAIGLKHGTDKSSAHHNYLAFYETFFAPLRHKEISILEIGVFGGASLRTWEEYFTKAKIVGADINPTARNFKSNRIAIELLDQSNIEELTQVAVRHGPFDIVIEDGSHMWEHQITSLRTLFPFLKNGGLYIAEDLQTNYGLLKDQYRGIASISCVDYLKKLVDLCVGDDEEPIELVEDAFLRTYGRAVEFVMFHRRACLIQKPFPTIGRGKIDDKPLIERDPSIPSIPVRVLAHISYRGDLIGETGIVNLASEAFPIQGFSLDTDDKLLEYRTLRDGDSTWCDWCEDGDFAGSRGESRTLIGLSVRLSKKAADRYSLRVFGQFRGLTEIVEVANGQVCKSSSGHPLVGFQIELIHRKR